MGIFRKEETTHFERDESGKVVSVTRNGQEVEPEEIKRKSTDQLLKEYYQKHPEKKHPGFTRLVGAAKRVDKVVVNFNRRSNPMMRTKPMQPKRQYSVDNNYNPFGSMFDMGMQTMTRKTKKPKTSSKTKYTVIGGKAYPIAGTSGKKKKKSRKKPKPYDPFKEWRL